ncbi:MAG: hypothetical protein FJW20_11600 [Acidimicrobiia bacterium]|nr:hypothetical protein [Acidimicrobiia bacterium]
MRLIALFITVIAMPGADWSSYRGPGGRGLGDSLELPAELGKEKGVVWKQATPKGNSSPIVVKDRVFLTGYEGDQRLVLCYESKSGRELWRASLEKARTEVYNPQNGPTTPSATSDGESVYVFLPELGLLAFGLDGKQRWKVELGPFTSIQGMASSPVAADGMVFLLVDNPDEAWVTAFDAKTGRERWKAKRPVGFLGGYSTPVVYRPASGPAQLIVAGARELTGYPLRTGERLWWANGITVGPAALPVVHGDSVYTVEPSSEGAPPFKSMLGADKNKDGKIQLSEYGGATINDKIMSRLMGSIDRNGNGDGEVTEEEWNKSFGGPAEPGATKPGGLVATKLGGKGDISSAVRWRATRGLPYVTSALGYEGLVYVIRENGVLTAYDAASGEVRKQARIGDGGEYWASPVGASGLLVVVSKDGKLTQVKAGAEWEAVSTADLEEKTIATPAIAGGRLFVRTEGTLYCFGKGS